MNDLARIGRVPSVNPVVFGLDHPLVDEYGKPTTWDDGPPCTELIGWQRPYLTVANGVMDYTREHLVADGRDPKRMTIVAKHVFRLIGPEVEFIKVDRVITRAYAAARREEGAKSATSRRELALLHAAVGHAAREGRITDQQVPKFFMPKTGASRLRWLTREEYRALMLQPMEYRIRMFFLLAFGTGARSQAIEQLTWSRVDFRTRVIDYRCPGVVYRNKRRAVVPISDALLPRLESAYLRRKDEFVIGAGGCTYRKAKAALAGIGITEIGVARHVARHTFASWLIQSRAPIAEVAQLLGDKVSMVESVYAHMLPDHTRASVNLALVA